MNEEVSKTCYHTANKILNILNQLGYSTEIKPAYENLLRDLITIEVRRNVNDVVAEFFNSVSLVPAEKQLPNADETKCCGGFSGACDCENETDTQN